MIPPIVVLAPLALLMADLPKEAEIGKAETKDPKTFPIPTASSSWVASIDFPSAEKNRIK